MSRTPLRNPPSLHVWQEAGGALSIALRVQPRARRPSIGGTARDADGAPRLKVAVTEPAEDGRANEAVLRALAHALGIAPSSLHLMAGAGAREKRIRAEGDTARLGPLLDRLAAGDQA